MQSWVNWGVKAKDALHITKKEKDLKIKGCNRKRNGASLRVKKRQVQRLKGREEEEALQEKNLAHHHKRREMGPYHQKKAWSRADRGKRNHSWEAQQHEKLRGELN